MTKLSALLVSILGVAACGDNLAATPDAPEVSAFPPRAVVVAGDFKAAGVLSTIDPATREVKTNVGPAMAVGSDPMLRHFGRELFIINRAENNITILDDQTLAFKEQIGTGAGSNPQDVAVVGNKLYVPTYGTTGVTVLTRGSNATTQIDLSADDPDHKPDCNSAYAVGTDVYVSCELLAPDFAPTAAGKVYVINSATNAIVGGRTITLLHKNPFGLFERIPTGTEHAGDLVITTVENFATPGCVERFTPGTQPSASSCWVPGTGFGGYATRAAFYVDPSAAITFFAVAKFPNADLFAFDMASNSLWDGALNPMTQMIADVAVCPGGEMVVYDGTLTASGLRVYNSSAERTTAALPIGIENGKFSAHGLVCY